MGLAPYGGEFVEPPAADPESRAKRVLGALREASHVRDFWLLAGAFFICGATTNGLIGTHLIAACSDHGLSEVKGAGLLAVIGVFDIAGTIGSGYLTDRYDPRVLLFGYYGLRGLSLLGLNAALAHAGVPLVAFVVFYGLDWVATVPPTVALCREHLRARADGRGVRVGVCLPPVRRGVRGLGRGRQPHLAALLRAGLPDRRRSRSGGRLHEPGGRPPGAVARRGPR